MSTLNSSKELSAHDASVFRSCVGILLNLSGDLPQCQYMIRYLSTFSLKPTEKARVVLRHLVGYMAAHADQCLSLKWKGTRSGVFKDYPMEDPIWEIFSDADWVADRQTCRGKRADLFLEVSFSLGHGRSTPLLELRR